MHLPRYHNGRPFRLTQIKAGRCYPRYRHGMVWLMIVLHLFIGATLAGVGIVVALVAGQGSALALAGAAVAGFLLAFPVAWGIARAMQDGPP